MNVELAEKVLTAIKADPSKHSQAAWWYSSESLTLTIGEDRETECGTTMCFAGWTALLSAPVGSTFVGVDVVFPGGKRSGISVYARNALHINHGQADVLFHSAWTIADLERMVSILADSPSAVPGTLLGCIEVRPDRFSGQYDTQ